MSHNVWSKAKDLRLWADTLEARQKLPALVRKLIHATVENPTLAQFPADEGTQRHGWDGVLEVVSGNAWVAPGWSCLACELRGKSDKKRSTSFRSSSSLSDHAPIKTNGRRWAASFGFDIGVFNQRGVTSRGGNDGGEQERELAKKYQAHAEKCKVDWPRTALVLRRIAENYEAEAKRHDERAEAGD